ncbi:MAG TPA: YidE/YbjL duplication, partial [Vicinamibacteria bacterium]|nr:YidE/YbjL duplication [Vicinamibacteria bacterium]
GVAIVMGALVTVMGLGHYAFGMSTDDLFGVVSGATGNAAILAYANRALPSDRIDVAFATVFPSMTILKILCAQVAIGVLGG